MYNLRLSNGKEEVIFRMEAKEKYLIFTNLGGIILGGVLLFVLMSIRNIHTITVFITGFIILVLYMIGNYIAWQKKGIRVVEIDKNGINFYRGKGKQLVRVEKTQITHIDFFSKLGRRIITIVTGGTAVKPFPGITLFFGPRVRISDDSFNDREFTVFVENLKRFK